MSNDINSGAAIRFDLNAFAKLFPEIDSADLGKVNELLKQAYTSQGKEFGVDLPLLTIEKKDNVLMVQLPSAPALTPPLEMDEMGGDGIAALLGWLQSDATTEATAAQALKIQGNSDELKRQTAEADKKRQEAEKAADRAKEAAESSKAGKLALTIFGMLAAVITAAVAFVFGGPALAAVAVVGLTMAILDTATLGLQNSGVQREDAFGKKVLQDISIGGLVQQAMESQLKDDVKAGRVVIGTKNAEGNIVDAHGNAIKAQAGVRVVTEADFHKDVMAVTIAVTVLLTVGMLATGIGGVKFAGEKVAQRAAEMVGKINKLLGTNASVGKAEAIASAAEAGVAIAEGVSTGAQAGLDIKLAKENLNFAETKALKKHMEALMQVLAQESEATRKMIEKLVSDLTESMSIVAKAIGNTGETMDHLAKNIASPSA